MRLHKPPATKHHDVILEWRAGGLLNLLFSVSECHWVPPKYTRSTNENKTGTRINPTPKIQTTGSGRWIQVIPTGVETYDENGF